MGTFEEDVLCGVRGMVVDITRIRLFIEKNMHLSRSRKFTARESLNIIFFTRAETSNLMSSFSPSKPHHW